jgi:hypothetical protein
MNQGSIQRRSLKTLVNKRFSVLSHRLRRPSRLSGSYHDIISEALLSEIRKEIMSTLDEMFGNDLKPCGGGVEDPDAGTGCNCRCCAQGGMFPQYPGNGGGFGTGQMEITIDQMVAETLMHGRQTSGVLRALFGLVPMLIGR